MRASASGGITRAPERPTKRSAPSITSAGPPVRRSGLVCSANQRLMAGHRAVEVVGAARCAARPWSRTRSGWRRRPRGRSCATATPAAPRPTISTLRSSRRLPVSFTALRSAASVTTAVPCWSSWKTGMSRLAFRRSSISKQRGALMSSRLMPPKPGAIASTVRDDRVGSLVLRQIGKASMPANSLKSMHLPSITGIAASGPMSPRPSTARAVGDDRDRVALDRVLEGLVAVGVDRHADARDAGRVGHARGRRGSSAGACCAARSCRRRACAACGRWCR